jgi:hypothetical protein
MVEGPPANEIAPSALKSGWLTKQGGSQSILTPLHWRKRFFILTSDGSMLYYYKTPQDDRPVGAITLSQFTHIERHLARKDKFCWKLYTLGGRTLSSPASDDKENQSLPNTDDSTVAVENGDAVKSTTAVEDVAHGRVYYAIAETEQEMQAWIDMLRPLVGLKMNQAQESPVAPPPVDDAPLPPPPPPAMEEQTTAEEQAEVASDSSTENVDAESSSSSEASNDPTLVEKTTLEGRMKEMETMVKQLETLDMDDIRHLHQVMQSVYGDLQKRMSISSSTLH